MNGCLTLQNLVLTYNLLSESKGKNHEDDENCIPTKENSNLRNMKPKNEVFDYTNF